MLSSRPLSRCLESGCHCCKKARNLNMESDACRRNTRSITILLRIVQRVHVIAANTNQKRRHLPPVRFAWVSRNSPRSEACQAGPSASWTKFHRNLAVGQVNRMWVPVSGTPHMGQRPSPGPCLLRTSTPEGRRSLRSCHMKLLIFRGRGAFHNGEAQALTGPLKRLR